MTQAIFPKLMSARIAFDIAHTLPDGLDRHDTAHPVPSREPIQSDATGAGTLLPGDFAE